MAVLGKISPELFQEFLATLAGAQDLSADSQRQLLSSYSELKYRLRGGSRCPLCQTHVRYVMPIYTVRFDRSEHSYPCLCTRCFEGEKGLSSKMVVRMGATSLIYERGERESFQISVLKNVAS